MSLYIFSRSEGNRKHLRRTYRLSGRVTIAGTGCQHRWNTQKIEKLNVYPDKKGIKDWGGAYEYGQCSPFGFGGSYYYTRLAYNF